MEIKEKKYIKKLDEIKNYPSGTYWKKVLLEIYRHAPHQYGESMKAGFYNDEHPIAKKLNIRGFELGLAISFLRNHKLVGDSNVFTSHSPNSQWINWLTLNDKGFEIASRLENQQSNQRLQKWIILFSGIATLTGLVSFIKILFNLTNVWIFIIYFFGILFIFFVIFSYENLVEKWKRYSYEQDIKNGGAM